MSRKEILIWSLLSLTEASGAELSQPHSCRPLASLSSEGWAPGVGLQECWWVRHLEASGSMHRGVCCWESAWSCQWLLKGGFSPSKVNWPFLARLRPITGVSLASSPNQGIRWPTEERGREGLLCPWCVHAGKGRMAWALTVWPHDQGSCLTYSFGLLHMLCAFTPQHFHLLFLLLGVLLPDFLTGEFLLVL